MNAYKNFLFDMDDTLKDFTNEDKIILNKIHKVLDIDKTIRCKILNLINTIAFKVKDTGLIKTNLNTLDIRLKIYSKILGVSLKKYSEEYYKFLDEIVLLFAGTKNIIEKLKEHNCNVYIITNNPTSKKIALDLNIPNENIYVLTTKENKYQVMQRIINENNLIKEQTVMVGDNLVEDIYNARKNKITSVWINYEDRLINLFSNFIRPDYCIHKIEDLIKLI